MTFNQLLCINVGQKGKFKKSGAIHTSSQDIDELFKHLKKKKTKKIVVHFQGALVSEKKGIEAAKKMQHHFEHTDVLPITFVWQTGLWETISHNLGTIHQTQLFKKLVKIAAREVIKKLGIDPYGKGNVSISDAKALKEVEGTTSPFEKYETRARGGAEDLAESDLPFIHKVLEGELEQELRLDPEMESLLENEANQTPLFNKDFLETVPPSSEGTRGISLSLASSLTKVIIRVLKRYIRNRHHDIYPTCVEEILREYYLADIGQWLWEEMKKVARNGMWKNNKGLEGEDQYVGSYFLYQLDRHLAENSLTVDFVGHSAGAIALCHMLRSIEYYNNIKIQNLIMLAPACNMTLFLEQVVKQPHRFQRFRLYTMSDKNEKKDQLVKQVYTRSFLYFVAGLLESEVDMPILGMQRFLEDSAPFNKDKDLQCIRGFLFAEGENRVVFSKSGKDALEGLRSQALQHKGFANDTATIESILHMICQKNKFSNR